MLSRTSHSKILLTIAHVIFYSQTKLFIFLLYGIVLRLCHQKDLISRQKNIHKLFFHFFPKF